MISNVYICIVIRYSRALFITQIPERDKPILIVCYNLELTATKNTKKKEDLFINTYLLKFSIRRKVNIRRIL